MIERWSRRSLGAKSASDRQQQEAAARTCRSSTPCPSSLCEISAHSFCVATLIDAGAQTKCRHMGYARVATLLHNHSFTLPHPSVLSVPISMHRAIG